MWTNVKKVIHWLDENLESTLCMILLSTFTIVLFLQVVMRKVFNNSLSCEADETFEN